MGIYYYSKGKPCYFCGANKKVTKEHVPPKMMFKNLNFCSLTVPSCEEHNIGKSRSDQDIISFLAKRAKRYLEIIDSPSIPITENLKRALDFINRIFERSKNRVYDKELLTDPIPQINNQLTYLDPKVRIIDWMRQLTAAILWSAIGKYDSRVDLGKANVYSSNVLSYNSPKSYNEIDLKMKELNKISDNDKSTPWQKGWSPYPEDIYIFCVHFMKNNELLNTSEVVFKHSFYNGISNWFVKFETPNDIKLTILNLIHDFNPELNS